MAITDHSATSLRKAFTLLEVIFVIVILGIVASIGSSIIVNVYESYIVQRALHRASIKTELAAQQIANRLASRISDSVIGREPGTTNFLPIDQLSGGNVYRALEWISYDNDSFSAQSTPGWSGYCDINESNRTTIRTPWSDLSLASTIIGNLGASADTDAAIIFAGHEYSPTKNYAASCMGFSDRSCISRVTGALNGTSISMNDFNTSEIRVITDQYRLVWSAYAIVPESDTVPTKLNLYYNYQPWQDGNYSTGSVSTLLDNVTVFKYYGLGDTIRFKICVQVGIGDQNISICKEKAVIR